jgi:hypothetical protein
MVAFFWCGLVIWSARLMAALLNSTSYFFTRWKRSHLEQVERATVKRVGGGAEREKVTTADCYELHVQAEHDQDSKASMKVCRP